MTHMIQIILGWHRKGFIVDFFGRIGYTHIEYARFLFSVGFGLFSDRLQKNFICRAAHDIIFVLEKI